MNVCVVGMGHFASIVAAVVASRGHIVAQRDKTPYLVRANQIAPDAEPGYTALAQEMREAGRLVTDLESVDVVWIAYDVPLDRDGAPEIDEVAQRIIALDRRVPKDIPFIVSCQWPAGTIAKLEFRCPGRAFVYALENVRAGKALRDFSEQTSMIVGVRDIEHQTTRNALWLLATLVNIQADGEGGILYMSPESAELSKHALNAFMALQIAFVNEIADVAEFLGASAADVSRALLSDPRVSPSAPLKPGKPFGGGSLQRDLFVLESMSKAPILNAIRASNDSRTVPA